MPERYLIAMQSPHDTVADVRLGAGKAIAQKYKASKKGINKISKRIKSHLGVRTPTQACLTIRTENLATVKPEILKKQSVWKENIEILS